MEKGHRPEPPLSRVVQHTSEEGVGGAGAIDEQIHDVARSVAVVVHDIPADSLGAAYDGECREAACPGGELVLPVQELRISLPRDPGAAARRLPERLEPAVEPRTRNDLSRAVARPLPLQPRQQQHVERSRCGAWQSRTPSERAEREICPKESYVLARGVYEPVTCPPQEGRGGLVRQRVKEVGCVRLGIA